MGKPHAVVLPLPVQGHVIPMMEFSYRLIDHGFKVTFINTEFNHKRILDSLSIHDDENNSKEQCPIRMISIPDGLEPEDDRNNFEKLMISLSSVLPPTLAEAIRKINANEDDDEVTCLIADKYMAWVFPVAEKMGIHRVAFCPASATDLAQGLIMPKLIQDGIIDEEGVPLKKQIIELAPNMPTMNSEKLPWNCIGDSRECKLAFKITYKTTLVLQAIDWILCNSSFELEPAAFKLFPKLIPIGPLLASSRLGRSSGQFWPEEYSTCLHWLDQQPARSVIYIAFGSSTIFEQIQFQELALGLELTGLRFLWVIRTDHSTIPLPDGFQTKVSNRGKIVSWAPQQSVLGHPSVACFFSHCGWNSTIEGVSHGVPFLCWPYFADQFLNQDYICDIWKIGLRLNKDENGIVPGKEICEKLNQVFNSEGLKARASKLMEATRKSLEDDGESSSKNLKDFINEMKLTHKLKEDYIYGNTSVKNVLDS